MHMADALISPVVGGVMWAATAGVAAYSVRKLREDLDEQKIPLMGVMGAFVFAAQMINFAIPATGSSGHIGGGLLLAILLGPYAGFLTMASVLLIQALFFADGGLLALGSNIFNLGFVMSFLAYPLIYKPLTRKDTSPSRILFAAVVAAAIGLQLGAFGVVLQTLFSGKTELPFGMFVLLMQPIHLAIGIVEGLVTAAVIVFVYKARPELASLSPQSSVKGKLEMKRVLLVLLIAAVLIGGGLSFFASSAPDGLEWAIYKTTGSEELEASGGVYDWFEGIQERFSFLPDYGFKNADEASELASGGMPDVGTGVSGLMGSLMTLVLAVLTGMLITILKRKSKSRTA